VPVEYRVYVIQNSAGKFYIGVSEDVAVLVQQPCGIAGPNSAPPAPLKSAVQILHLG
jgi:hypothetical protein